MPPVGKPLGTAVLVAAVLAALYGTRLSFAPIYLIHDEVKFSLQAQAIAATGRDLNGRLLPVYFSEPEFPAGRDPVMIYLTALALRVLPLSEMSVRLPTALVGVLSAVLMFLLGRRLFANDALGLVAAGLLALTPAHFMHSRLALSIAYPIPFIIGWLMCLRQFDARGSRRALVGGAVVLALGIYSYLASVVMMPIYLLLSAVPAVRRGVWRQMVTPVALGFALPLIPILLWQVAYPERYADLIAAYRLHSGQPTTGASTGLGLLSYEAIRLRINLYWAFFSPDFLFIEGDSNFVNSTRQIGFLPLACAVFIPVGVFHIVRRRTAMGLVVLLGFFTAPVAGVISGQLEVNRLLFVIPFAALTATYGVSAMLASVRPGLRWAAVLLLLTVPWQFWGFYQDYVGPYRVTSSTWLGGNLRGAYLNVLSRSPTPSMIYLNRIPYGDAYWRFYALAAGRRDLVDRPQYREPDEAEASRAPSDAILVMPAGRTVASTWEATETIAEPNDAPAFVIYAKR